MFGRMALPLEGVNPTPRGRYEQAGIRANQPHQQPTALPNADANPRDTAQGHDSAGPQHHMGRSVPCRPGPHGCELLTPA